MASIRVLFVCAAIYDLVLGLAFCLAPASVFARFDVPPPNHYGYVQFGALLLIMFGVMFGQIAWQPLRYCQLIPYGMWLKASYCLLAFWYWFQTDIPWMWKPFAIADAVMLVLFAWSYFALSRPTR